MFKSLIKSAFIYGLLVSVPATIVDWSVFAFGDSVLNLHYSLNTAAGIFCGTIVNALLSRKIAFNSKNTGKKKEMPLLLAAGIASYFLNLLFISFFVEIIGIEPKLSKVITTFIVFAINYGIRQFFIFDSKPKWK